MKKIFIFLIVISICQACNNKGEILYVEVNQSEGFNYPYFLFIPAKISDEKELFIIIEPNNSGFADDDLKKHVEKAERTASKDYYMGNYVARKLKYPLLVPVFPRSQSEWKIYTHALDRDVMRQKNNQLERIDLQLLKMFNHAKLRLKELGIKTSDQFLMTGFSASGTFANRFTLLHPNKVKAVAAGGLNGLLALPLDSLGGKPLHYPIGTNDFKVFLNQVFQKQAFVNIPQFYFMGALDANDAVPYDDAFDQDERELIYELLGKEMLPTRWKACANIYKNEGVNASVKTYSNIGHEHPDSVKQEIVEFFKTCLNY